MREEEEMGLRRREVELIEKESGLLTFCFLLRFGTYRPSSSRSASSSSSAGFVVISLSFDLELLSSLLPSLPSSFLHPPSVVLPTYSLK